MISLLFCVVCRRNFTFPPPWSSAQFFFKFFSSPPPLFKWTGELRLQRHLDEAEIIDLRQKKDEIEHFRSDD